MKIILTLAAQTGLPYEPTAQHIVEMPAGIPAGDQQEVILDALSAAWNDLKQGMTEDREKLLLL